MNWLEWMKERRNINGRILSELKSFRCRMLRNIKDLQPRPDYAVHLDTHEGKWIQQDYEQGYRDAVEDMKKIINKQNYS